MGNLKEKWKNLAAKLQNGPKNTQGKAFVRILQFFAIMLVLTIFARGTAGVTMPRVTAQISSNAEISQTIDTSGTVVSLSSVEVELPAGVTIKKIVAPQGTNVKEGDALIELDIDAMQDELTRQKVALEQARIELREMQKGGDLDTSGVDSAQKAVNDAQSAYDKAVSAQHGTSAAITDATNNYNAAVQARDAAKPAYDAEMKKVADNQDSSTPYEPNSAVIEAYTNAETTVLQREGELTVAKQADVDAKAAIETAQSMLNDARSTLEQAQKAQQTAQEGQALDNEKNALAITLKKLDIEKQEAVVSALQIAVGNGGVIVAPSAGVVQELLLEEGTVTTEGSVIKLSTSAEGYVVECFVPQKDASELQMGGTLYVKVSGAYYSNEATVISKSAPNAEGNVKIRASLPGTDWNDGTALEVNVVLSRRSYGQCVPLRAVHQDEQGNYVYVLRERETILGTQLVAVKESVTVIAQDRTNVAIEWNYWNEQVLVDSSKPVSEGDRVRIDNTGNS